MGFSVRRESRWGSTSKVFCTAACTQRNRCAGPADFRSIFLRKADARTKEAPWTTIGTPLADVSPNECRNDPTDSGYGRVTAKHTKSSISIAFLSFHPALDT